MRLDKQMVATRFAAGWSDRQIADACGGTPQAVRRVRLRAGLLRQTSRHRADAGFVDHMPKPASEAAWAAALNGRRFA